MMQCVKTDLNIFRRFYFFECGESMIKWVVFFILISGAILGGFSWKNSLDELTAEKAHEKEKHDLQLVELYIAQNNWLDASRVIRQYQEQIETYSPNGKRWLELLIHVSRKQGNLSQLMVLHRSFPYAFENSEESSLIVADQYLVEKNLEDYQRIRDQWKGREFNRGKWILLDADYLAQQKKLSEAADLLLGVAFDEPAHEGERLNRLALVHLKNQQKRLAWETLAEALEKDPHNTEIRSYRGKVLEGMGKKKLAFNEYLAAFNENPENIFLIDQLAEFHLRQKEFPEALNLWSKALGFPSLDLIWVKALFWSRLAAPIDFKSYVPPKGRLQPLIKYLAGLPEDQPWDEAAFQNIPDHQVFLAEQQGIFWLRLLKLLRDGQELEASALIQQNSFQDHSWDPHLEQTIYQIIAYRKNLSLETFVAETTSIPFLSEINAFAKAHTPFTALPKDLSTFILNDEVFAAAFLFAGWKEAALKLQKNPELAETSPDWLAYELTLALWENRGIDQALEFAAKQKPSPLLSLAIGEILIEKGDLLLAYENLAYLIELESEIGMHAAELVSELHLLKNEYELAREVIYLHPELVDSVQGQEALAQIALQEGDLTAAEKIYRVIEEQSAAAKSYFAQKALKEKDWKRAQELTLKLLADAPHDTLLMENLRQIQEAVPTL